MQITDEVRSTFLAALITDLKDAGKLPRSLSNFGDVAMALYGTLGGDAWLAGYEEYSPALIDALKLIYSWDNAVVPRSISSGITLSLSLQVPVGRSTVTLQAVASKSAFQGASQELIWWGLWSELQTGYAFFKENPPLIPQRANGDVPPVALEGEPPEPPTNGNRKPAADQESVELPIDAFVVESKGGKTYFKVKAGQWQTFGISVWPEVLKRDVPEALTLAPGEYSLKGTCRVLVKGGKGQKVTAINVS